jgi:hypothetical protein
MKFTIKSEWLEHKDQIIMLDFSKMGVIDSIEFGMAFNYDKYERKSVWGKYLGPSRIDGFPMFEIDTTGLDREEKIDEILEK